MMEFSLRAATKQDAAYLLVLEELCMRAYAEALWGTWQPSAASAVMDVHNHRIIEVDGAPAGCVASAADAQSLWVKKLYIHPAFQNRGLGARILQRVVDEAAGMQLPVRLTVLTTNPARKFYERAGFNVESETPERRTMVKRSNKRS